MNARPTAMEIDHIGRGYDSVAARSSSIDTRCYRDARFLAVEQEQIFWRAWQFLCHGEQLRTPGSYVAGDVQGRSVVAVRGGNGELRAFYNVCKHRGHELLRGSGNTRFITCPYHAWVYNLDGRLKHARRCELIENFDPADISLSSIQVEEFCGLVFVNLDPTAAPLTEQAAGLATEIESYAPDIEFLTHGHRLTYRVQANWKAIVDNFLECYHCPMAHRDFVTLVEMDTYKINTHDIWSSHMAKAGRGDNKAYEVDGASVTDHAVWYLWPNTTLMRYPGRGNFMVWRFIPISAEETYEVFDFYFESAPPSESEMKAIRFIDEVLQPEDIGLIESVQRGMRTPAFAQGRYMVDPEGSGLSEHAVHHFHGLVLKAYQAAANL